MNYAPSQQACTGSPRAERLSQREVAEDRYAPVRLYHVGMPGELLWVVNANWNDGCSKLWNNMLPPPGCLQLEARLWAEPDHTPVGLPLFLFRLLFLTLFSSLFFQVDCAGCSAALHLARGEQRKRLLTEKCKKEMKHLEDEQERDNQVKLKADAEDRAWANADKYANPSLVQIHSHSQTLLLDDTGSCELELKVCTIKATHLAFEVWAGSADFRVRVAAALQQLSLRGKESCGRVLCQVIFGPRREDLFTFLYVGVHGRVTYH